MKILIFGASGTVGGAIYQALCGAGYQVHGTFNKNRRPGLREFNIADTAGLRDMLGQIRPDLIISALAGGFAEQSAAHASMADYLRASGGRIIYISSARVFDGAAGGNHTEDQAPYNISQYGSFKQICEEMLLWRLQDCLVARLPKIITGAGAILPHIKNGGGFYSNLYFNYNTPAGVAGAIKYCIESNKRGVAHLVSREHISDAELAKRTLAKAGLALEFKALELTPESYCALLGCRDASRLRLSSDGGFYLTMRCTDGRLFDYLEVR